MIMVCIYNNSELLKRYKPVQLTVTNLANACGDGTEGCNLLSQIVVPELMSQIVAFNHQSQTDVHNLLR